MTVLADTSVWVDYLRRGVRSSAAALDDLLVSADVVVCGPVVAELLAGAKAPDRPQLWQLFAGLPWADLERSHWKSVGEASARLRESGASVALTDVEIAVAAVGAGAELWTNDRDFRRIASVLGELRFFEP